MNKRGIRLFLFSDLFLALKCVTLWLGMTLPLHAYDSGLRISEFMARNDTVLTDEDGDCSDWIEIYNAGTGPIDLAGYHLTDDAGQLSKWTFPSMPISTGEVILVFASGKNRASYSTNGVSFITQGAVWKYLDNGSDPGTEWVQTDFNDTAWNSGTAELGYGDGDEATTLAYGNDAQNKHITSYFRHSFVVTNPTSSGLLTLKLLRDDGAIVYLNGIEIVRDNMPNGTITSSTLSSNAAGTTDSGGGLENVFYSYSIDSSFLLAGTNVVAVEIHQCSGNSSDISFDLQLTGSPTWPHANFSLSDEGEYLALTAPDGTNIVCDFGPEYPEQYSDISYGYGIPCTTATLRIGQPGYFICHSPGIPEKHLPGTHPLYCDESAAQVDIGISQSDWDTLMSSPWNETERRVTFRFRHGDIDCTLSNVGIRCRGNTSRDKFPRSLRVSFNSFIPGQKLFGMEKLNFNSEANDPSRVRSKLVNELSHAAGLPASLANQVALVVHGPSYHRGSYQYGDVFFDSVLNNTQPIDDVFVKMNYGSSRGNLYKCNSRQWEANLSYRGESGEAYIGNGTTYELKYQGGADSSYNDLAGFIDVINNTSDEDFPTAILQVFDVDSFLKRLAIDVLSGNWDDYWVNANNYYLFFNPLRQKWVYIPYDFDNAWGIRWLGSDWAYQNIYTFGDASTTSNTPLADRIMAVPEFKNRYSYYVNELLQNVYSYERLNAVIYHLRDTLTASLPFGGQPDNMMWQERSRYQSDWPFWSYDNFYNSYDYGQSYNVPNYYGLTEFIALRRTSALSQLVITNIAPIISNVQLTPDLPRTENSILLQATIEDDTVAFPQVQLIFSFNGGTWFTNLMTKASDANRYYYEWPAFNTTGTVAYYIAATDEDNRTTYEPFGGRAYANLIEIGSASLDIVITEINYNPHIPNSYESLVSDDNDDYEFIEIYNAGSSPLELQGFAFTDGITFSFPSHTIAADSYGIVVKNQSAFEQRYGRELPVIGEYSGSLKNSGEDLELRDATAAVVASFSYDDGGDWPGRADGNGSSLELIQAGLDYTRGSCWRSSSEFGGTPGTPGQGADNRIVINEVLTHTDPPLSDMIELYNTTESAINIGNWFLSDDKDNFRKFRIPADTILGAGAYIVFNETNHFNQSAGLNTNDFALSGAHGDDVWLMEADVSQNLLRFVDHVEFGAAANGESFGRWPNASRRLYPMKTRSFGATNSGPRVGPVVITELMYNPPGLNSGSNEYIEIFNGSSVDVNLTNWQLGKAIEYMFPTNAMLPPGERLLVVSFDTLDTDARDRFRTTYGIDNEVRIMGPYTGQLSNDGENIQLYRPDEPPLEEPAFIPMLLEDEVRYNDKAPWPEQPDGEGTALVRLAPTLWGNEPANWAGCMNGSPGSGDPVVDADQNSLPDTWEMDTFGRTNTPAGQPGQDPDHDGFNNYEEYIAGTSATSSNSQLQLEIIWIDDSTFSVSCPTIAANGNAYFSKKRYYDLLYNDQLTGTEHWQAIPGVSNVLGRGQTIGVTNESASTDRQFLRIRVRLD